MLNPRTWIAVLALCMLGCSGGTSDDIRGLGSGARDGGGPDDAEVGAEDGGEPGTERDAAAAEDAAPEEGGLDAGDPDASPADASETPDAGGATDSSSDAASDDADANSARGLYVDPANGLNTNDGQQGAPFKTIEHAASMAMAGDTIWLLPGTYDPSTEPRFLGTDAAPCGAASGIVVPAGVTVRAVMAGQASLRVNAPHGFCMTGGALIGLDLGFVSQGGTLIEVSAGDVLIEGTKISRAGTGGGGNEFAIHAQGTAHVVIRPGGLDNLIAPPNYKYAVARDQGVLEVQGGTLRGNTGDALSGNAAFLARDQGEVILDDVRVEEFSNQNAVFTSGSGKVTLRNGTVIVGDGSGSQGGVRMSGTSTLVLQGATLRNLGTAVVSQIYVANNPTINATDSVLENNTNGIYFGGDTSPLTANVSFTGGAIRANTNYGVYSNIPGNYVFDGTHVVGNGNHGLDLSNPANLVSLKLRRTLINDNGRTGVLFAGAASSVLDLGTLADPGDNSLAGNATVGGSEAGVRVTLSGALIQAVGNTWNPNTQAAGPDGRYAAVGAGAVLDVTSASGSGTNYVLGANTTLRLAANP